MSDASPRILCRSERPEDAAFRARLFRETQGAILTGLDPALVDLLLRQQLAGQTMSYRAAYPDARYEIIEWNGEPVGRIVIDHSGGTLRLVDIALMQTWRGRGIGTALLRDLLGEAGTCGLPVRLAVAPANTCARRLYERLGFVVESASETAIAMLWEPHA